MPALTGAAGSAMLRKGRQAALPGAASDRGGCDMADQDASDPMKLPHSTLAIAARHWRWVVADGVIGLIFGVLALVYPSITVLALGVLLGIGLLMQGVLEIYAAVKAWPGTPGRVSLTVIGILVLVAGIICIVQPGAGVFAITLGLAIWFLLSGIADLGLAASGNEHRLSNLVLGIIEVAAALILVLDRNAAIATIAIIAGVSFIVRGALAIYLGWKLRALAQSSERIP
jgi:uncharacterized membrane protein HdeD (DUF308 family)